ncbi:MAG: glucose 1-dehydrogenase [Maricaulaceae bacterium]
MGRLTGKVAIITGGSRGLGEATARAMAAEGAAVLITDLRAELGEAVAADITVGGGKAAFLTQDVTDEARWAEVFAHAQAEFGAANVLVNNAGIALVGTIEDTSYADWRKTQAVNMDAVFLGTQAAVRHMKESGGGSVINISSIEGIVGNPVAFAYNASKGAVRILTKSAAIYCAKAGYGIRVNSVHPGFVPTDMVMDAVPLAPEGFVDEALAMTPMNRFGEPSEIANGVVFLASDESSYMTGSELVIDGGFTAQ